MGLQTTGSRTDLLLECQYPFGKDVEVYDPPGEPARYGSAFHFVLAAVLTRWLEACVKSGRNAYDGVREVEVSEAVRTWALTPSRAQELPEHVEAGFGVLREWLKGKNPWSLDFTQWASTAVVERAFIIRPGDLKHATAVRTTELPDPETHFYKGLKRGEIAMTLDLRIGPLILDHKTGHQDFSSPTDLGQLRTAALLFQDQPDLNGGEIPFVAVLDADRRGIPAVYGEEFDSDMAFKHEKALRRALRRVDDGSMRPGPWCTTCPARDDCPTQNNDLLLRSAALVKRASDELEPPRPANLAEASADEVARVHFLINQFERLAKPTKEAVRAWVREHPKESAVREDGKVLQFITKNYTNLSQASIVRAYGKKAGEKLIAKLKKDGAIEEGKREELWALNDK